MSLEDLLGQLPLPITGSGDAALLAALAVGMAVEDEVGITLTDEELSPSVLGDVDSIRALLRRRGVGP